MNGYFVWSIVKEDRKLFRQAVANIPAEDLINELYATGDGYLSLLTTRIHVSKDYIARCYLTSKRRARVFAAARARGITLRDRFDYLN